MLPEQDLLDYILDETYTSRHILLIDPANQSPEKAAQRCIIAVEEGTRMILLVVQQIPRMKLFTKHVFRFKKHLN